MGRKDKKVAQEEDKKRKREEKKKEKEEVDDEKPKKRKVDLLSGVINEEYMKEKFIKEEKEKLDQRKPFAYSSLPNFFDPELLQEVKKELQEITFYVKGNDLYDFLQSDALKKIDSPAVSRLAAIFNSDEFADWMRNISGIPDLYGGTADMFSAVYGDTSKLLCHDDRLEGRRVAFIIYLTPEGWEDIDGGHLDLFDCDPTALEPTKLSKSLLPTFNTFNFFKVGDTSYHQVREVLSRSGRTSISGWFKGPPFNYKSKPPSIYSPQAKWELPPLESEGGEGEEEEIKVTSEEEKELAKWISPIYLKPESMKGVNEKIMEDGSVFLQNFFIPSIYDSILAQFRFLELAKKEGGGKGEGGKKKKRPKTIRQRSEELKKEEEGGKGEVKQPSLPGEDNYVHWEAVGPANRRHYYRLKGIQEDQEKKEDGKEQIASLFSFLRSPAFSSYVRSLSGLDLIEGEGDVRRFGHGCYTLMNDDDPTSNKESLDVYFTFIGNEEWEEDHGGWVSYIAKDEEDGELLTVTPIKNSMAIVFRDTGCLKFMKYLNRNAPASLFDISMTFSEAEGSGEGSSDEEGSSGEEEEPSDEEESSD